MIDFDTTPTANDCYRGQRYRGQWYVIKTTCTASTTSTVSIDSWYYFAATTNYVVISEPLPKCETDSQIQLARMAAFGVEPFPLVPVGKAEPAPSAIVREESCATGAPSRRSGKHGDSHDAQR